MGWLDLWKVVVLLGRNVPVSIFTPVRIFGGKNSA
jgi:hypothetical protein